MSASTTVKTSLHLALRGVQATAEWAGHLWTRRRDRAMLRPGTCWTHYRGASVVASPWVSARAALDATLEDCITALARIDHEVAGSGWELPVVRVAADDWDRAMVALRASPAPLYLAPSAPGGPITVHRAWADAQGRFVAGPDVGVVLTTQPATIDVATDASAEAIDVVFTWVDGSDPAWQQRRAQRGDQPLGLHPTASNAARFDQIGELRLALAAVERFAPWRRQVFLVTDGQRPAWLAQEFPQVVVVTHEQLFTDPTALPTFNSHAIESRLHHVPGLAERWLYLNDDIFLGRYTPPSTFFDRDGRMAVFATDEPIPSTPVSPADPPVVAAGKNTRDLLTRLAPGEAALPKVHRLKHVPHPQLRSLTLELEALAPEQFGGSSQK